MNNILSFLEENNQFIIPLLMFLAVITAGIVAFYFSSKNRILRELKKRA